MKHFCFVYFIYYLKRLLTTDKLLVFKQAFILLNVSENNKCLFYTINYLILSINRSIYSKIKINMNLCYVFIHYIITLCKRFDILNVLIF